MKIISIFYIIPLILIFTSCSKKSEIGSGDNTKDLVGVIINIAGIEDSGNVNLSANTKKINNTFNIVKSEKISLTDEYDAFVTLTEETISDSNSKSYLDTLNRGKITKIASSSPMPSGRNYVIVFQDANGNFIEAINANSSSVSTFTKANYNTTYKWFAYSYNDNLSLTYNNNSPFVISTWNRPLLYDSGTFTTSNTGPNNTLNIVFKRKSAIIEYVVDHRGIHDVPHSLKIAPTGTGTTESQHHLPIKNGEFNLKTGLYTSTNVNPTINDDSLYNFRTTISGIDSIRKAEFHTVSVQPITSVSITFSQMRYLTDLGPGTATTRNTANDKQSRDWQWATLNTAPGFTSDDVIASRKFELTGLSITPVYGKRYRMIITLLPPKITMGGTDWAFGNLYYFERVNPFARHYQFRHHSSNLYGTVTNPDANMYWRWKSLVPGTADGTKDPCSYVFPKGYWKLPTSSQTTNLINITSSGPNNTAVFPRKYSQHSTGDPMRYVEITNEASQSAYWPYNWRRVLILPQLGYRTSSGTLTNYVTNGDNSTSIPAYGYYWTESGTSTNPIYLLAVTGTTNSSSATLSNNNSSTLNDGRMLIKCVRNTAYIYNPNLP